MSTVGQIEKRTQARIVALFQERLGYDYLGDNTERDNRNIEPTLLTAWLARQGVSDSLITRALHELNKVATDTSKSLYDRNRDVYDLLRYGLKLYPHRPARLVQPGVSQEAGPVPGVHRGATNWCTCWSATTTKASWR